MKTVKQVSELTGCSVRALHHYDAIGLLKPTAVTQAGYRLYDDAALERLQQILLFRELEFPLKEIRDILESPRFDRGRALEQQIELLTLKKNRLENLIRLAREIKNKENKPMDFTAFDTSGLDRYAAEVKAAYGQTPAYQEYTRKAANRTASEAQTLAAQMMEIFAGFHELRALPPEAEDVQRQVIRLKEFITAHYYTCTDEILAGLSVLYTENAEFSDNIDRACGAGTAAFAAQAIRAFCAKQG